jgi:acetolactate synthase-1/2/3 large subunit
MRLADYVIKFFEDNGVQNIFTVSGGGAIFLCDAVAKSAKINYVSCHHEQAASIAAEAYSRFHNTIGVCIVTSGPGGTNAITGVAGAWLDHVPQITVSGQTFLSQTIGGHPGLRTLGVQEINIIDIVKPITKYAVMLTEPNDVRYHLEKATYLAKDGRPGPVWIDIPADIQNKEIELNSLRVFDKTIEFPKILSDIKDQVTKLINVLLESKRPLIHIGQGIRLANAEKDLFNLLDHLNVPFITARNGNDLTESIHPLYVGRSGTYAQRGANFAVQTSDLYIAIGTRLSLAQTGYNPKDYAKNAFKVVVDVDKSELNKGTIDIDLKINIDAKVFIGEFSRQLSQLVLDNKRWGKWLSKCKEWQKKYPVVLPEYKNQERYVNSYYFIDILSELMSEGDAVVTDMGFAFQNTHQAINIKKDQRVFTNCGLASMGWGLPAAVGVAISQKKGQTICISGEGGLQMNIQELATIAHHKLPIKIFVLNNGGYLTIKQTQEIGFNGRLMGCNEDSGLSFPEFSNIAQAYRIKFIKISSQENLSSIIQGILNSEGPVFCEIMMDPNQELAPKALNRKNPDGTSKQTALEDAYPFLPVEEIALNMSIINDLN